jgi:all-trans-retinol 13,14-reductase
MKVGKSYKQHPIAGDWDAIVIGSGLGGLAAAALLARHGRKRVAVLERHYTAGGFTHAFTRPGYEWDVGVHYVGEVHRSRSLLRRLFDEITDGALEWADMGDVYDTIIIGDDHYQLVKGRERFRERMRDYFPAQRDAVDEYIARVRTTVKKSRGFFMEKALPPAAAAVAGPAMRWPLLRDARRTTAEVMAELTDDPLLTAVLTGQFGDYGLPPAQSSWYIHASVVNHYFAGAAYPVGGAGRIAETILPAIEAAGGCVRTRAEVDEIVCEQERAVGVRLVDGNVLRAPIVISDAGVPNTFGRLVPRDVADRHHLRSTVPGAGASVAHVSLYVGLDRTAAELGLERSNLWVYPSDDHDGNVERYLADRTAPLPVAYISFPSAKDPDFERRHPGKATIEVVSLAPFEWFQPWVETRWQKRGDEYEALKRELHNRMLDVLVEQVPSIRGRIAHAELSTPLSTRHFAGHPRGEIYGLSHTPARFEARWLRPRTPVRGLYLTGADIVTAGIGGALFGGLLSASAVLKKNLLDTILAAAPRR